MRLATALSIALAAATSTFAPPAQTQTLPDPTVARTVLKPRGDAKVEIRTIVYRGADNAELPADFYFTPDVKEPRPAILLVSGAEDARDWAGYRDFGRLAAERGFIGIVPAKRFPRGGEGIAKGRSDTLGLLEQLSKLAPDLIDRSRVVLWVFSGGGTTLSVAYGENAPKLSCAVGFYPALSLAVPAPEEWLNTYSPAHALALHGGPGSPPALLLRAGRDTEMLNNGIADFVTKALKRNVPLTLMNLPDAQHGFDLFDNTAWSREAIEAAFEFACRATRH